MPLPNGIELKLKWLGGKPTKWEVLEDFFDVPAGFITDLSSIPKMFRFYLSKGEAAPAAVLHDYDYYTGIKRKNADKRFKKYCVIFCDLRKSQSFVLWAVLRLTGWVAFRAHRKRREREQAEKQAESDT